MMELFLSLFFRCFLSLSAASEIPTNFGQGQLDQIVEQIKLFNKGEVAPFVELFYYGTATESFSSVLPALKMIVESKVANQISCPAKKNYQNYHPNYDYISNRYSSYRTAGYLRRDDIHLPVISALHLYSSYLKDNNRELYYDNKLRSEILVILDKIIKAPNVSQLALEAVAEYSADFIPLSYANYLTILRRVNSTTSSWLSGRSRISSCDGTPR